MTRITEEETFLEIQDRQPQLLIVRHNVRLLMDVLHLSMLMLQPVQILFKDDVG